MEARLQYRMPFDAATDGTAPQPAPAPEPAACGLFSGRVWRSVTRPDPGVVAELRLGLAVAHRVDDHVLTLLASRGLATPEELDRFFYPRQDHGHDPLVLDEMEAAARRVLRAAAAGERVAVHGDFDVDGITGTALLAELLGAVRVDGRGPELVEAFVPDRARDGYGVALRKIEQWVSDGVDLLVTVDTGAAAYEALDLARRGGMEVVVLDHHLFEGRPRGATVLVNPRRVENRYANPELCGVAVAYKLAEAVTRLAPGALPDGFLAGVLDLTALGLIADQMALVGENRMLVCKGLERINDLESRRPGLHALLSVSGLDRGFPVGATDIAYQLAPRLNACGRVGRVEAALRLLLTRNSNEAAALAREADASNQKRKQMDQEMKEQAAAMARPFVERGDPGLVLGSALWHKGVIGICASRLVEMFGVPAILCAVEGGEARGSARSVPGVDVKAAMDRCADLLIRHGGHAQAAGITLRSADLDAFREAFLEALRHAGEDGPAVSEYDLELDLEAMSMADVADLTRGLERLAPFGEGNRLPVLRCNGVRLRRPPQVMGRTGDHLRFGFAAPDDGGNGGTPALSREFVCFGHGRAWNDHLRGLSGGLREAMDGAWDILFTVAPNTWRPRDGRAVDPVQQQLLDLKPAES